ncbi:MAG TPA: trigger factor [Xanthomonadaceae bacterium]|nr:trigger factor [Xanthomonadaceae bacterium]
MQVSVESTGKLGRRLTVTIPADRVHSGIQSRLRELSRTARIKGFRPGKVPASVIEKRFGDQVREEVLSDLVRNTFDEALRQQNLRPAMAPEIDATPAFDSEFQYTATFEVLPEVDKLEVEGLEITRVVSEVADVDVDAMIETLRHQRRTWQPVDREAAATDMVVFEYSAEHSGGRFPAEGVERAGTIVGSGALGIDFEQHLVGLATGAEKSFDVALPDSFRIEALAGKQVTMQIKVIKVQASHLPEVDDEFVRSFGVADGSMEKFRHDVAENLKRELHGALMGRLKAEVVAKLTAAYPDVDLPEGMIEAEARALARQKGAKAGEEGDLSEHRDAARQRVLAGVLLQEAARKFELRLEPRRVSELLAMIASTYEDPQAVVDAYRSDARLMSGLQSRAMEDQVVDFIASKARVTEQPMTFAEVMRPTRG